MEVIPTVDLQSPGESCHGYYKSPKTSSLILRNNMANDNSPLKQTNLIYHFKCTTEDCALLPNSGYIDMTTTSLSHLDSLSPEGRLQPVGEWIFQALKGIGFVYLLNHGLPEPLQKSAFQTARDFFTLPLDTKLKYRRFVHSAYNGYTPLEGEMLSRSEEHPGSLHELKEAWDTRMPDRDMPTDEAPAFCREMAALMAAFDTLSLHVLGGLELAMGRPGVLTSAHQHQVSRGTSDMRTAYYPPLPEPVPVGAVRCATHSDWGSISLLLQDDCGGLEVLDRSGDWVPAPPVPGAVLLNVGDLMEIWTGGEIRATKHRVRVPDEERLRRNGRMSLIFFSFPDEETMVQPPTGPAVNAGKYLAGKLQATMPTFASRVTRT